MEDPRIAMYNRNRKSWFNARSLRGDRSAPSVFLCRESHPRALADPGLRGDPAGSAFDWSIRLASCIGQMPSRVRA